MPTRTATGGLPSVSANSERVPAGIARRGAELLLDAQQLVVLVDALATRRRTGLDLAGVGANRQIGNGGVLGFTRAVRDHGGVARLARHFDGLERLGHAADLVDLDENRVSGAVGDATA